jgi:hypothetical protein
LPIAPNKYEACYLEATLQKFGSLAVTGLEAKPRDVRLGQTHPESESEPFVSYAASRTPGLPSARFDMGADEGKGSSP